MTEVNIIGIDLAKNIFQVHGADAQGKKIFNKKISRSQLKSFISNYPNCIIAMEACSSSHYWGRVFKRLNYTVRLIAPHFVKPYVKSNKNDAADAEAIAEAAIRSNMRFVAVKETWQQDILCIHRIRSRLVRHRTSVAQEIRGLLGEYGVVVPKGITKLQKDISEILSDNTNELTINLRELIQKLVEELWELNSRVKFQDNQLLKVFNEHHECKKLDKIDGVGPITATAVIAMMGDPKTFKNGRQFSAWLGLVPRQHSSGGKERLLGISKRGDKYLRKLLINGARATLRYVEKKEDARSNWIKKKIETIGFNKTCVAVANKNARIIWAMLNYETEYKKAA